MKVLTVCGMGFGTSLMMLMTIQEIASKHGKKVEGEATDLGSYKGKPCDLIVASSEIAKQIEEKITEELHVRVVIGIGTVVNHIRDLARAGR